MIKTFISVACALFAATALALDFSADERQTFDGSHADNQATACQTAKTRATLWLDQRGGMLGAGSLAMVDKQLGSCSCDRPPAHQEQKFCYTGTPDCRSDGTKIVLVPQPVVCIVDARLVARKR